MKIIDPHKILIYYTLSRLDRITPLTRNLKAFTNDKDAEAFLERLAKIKMRLAFRCSGKRYKKTSDAFRRAGYRTHGVLCTTELTRAGRETIDKNVYKLAVEIVHNPAIQ